ncbi:MAG: MDR family MFS transporter [Alphaproteobacteria bacterium]
MTAVQTFDTRQARKIAPPREIAPPVANQDEDYVSPKTWMAVIGGTIGAFLAVLNIQVVNSSLADIQGAIGAGLDTGGWISTAYLVAEIIVIPLSGWLARSFSLRNYLLASGALFLAFSVACAQAHNLSQMIVFRALQGFSGGVLIPLAYTIVLTQLPRKKQAVGTALFAFAATFAPAIGPTVGGWLNDTLGWQFIFYVNLIPGALMLVMLWASLEPAPMNLGLLKQGDWAGIATIAVGLGALQTVLEEGNRHDWFGDRLITDLSIISAISLVAFVFIELRSKRPLVNLRLLAGRNFGLGNTAFFILGGLLYGTIFILPLYLTELQGYNATQIGVVVAWTGLPQLLIIPFVPRLLKMVDARALVAFGFALFAISCFMNTELSPDVAGPQLLIPNVIRAIGQALILTPLLSVANSGLAAENASTSSALVNMFRNLGGAIAIAGLQTFLTKREQFHSNIINENVSLFDEATRARIAQITHRILASGVSDPALAQHEAIVAVGRTIRKQATIMGFSDVFMALGVMAVLAFIVTLFLKKGSGSAAGAH